MNRQEPRPLTTMQMELLQQCSFNIPEEDLEELRTIIAKYLFEKAIAMADKIAQEKGYTQETFDQWLNEDS
jgi:hypothetical protein